MKHHSDAFGQIHVHSCPDFSNVPSVHTLFNYVKHKTSLSNVCKIQKRNNVFTKKISARLPPTFVHSTKILNYTLLIYNVRDRMASGCHLEKYDIASESCEGYLFLSTAQRLLRNRYTMQPARVPRLVISLICNQYPGINFWTYWKCSWEFLAWHQLDDCRYKRN